MSVAIASGLAAFFLAAGCAVAGVYLLAGAGWALIAGGIAWLVVCVVLIRGVRGVNSGGK